MAQALYPSLIEIPTRIWLYELSAEVGRAASLRDVPDSALDRLAARGFDWVWLLGVWQTGAAGRKASLCQDDWRRGYQSALPDYTDDDVTGSPFAVQSYAVHADFGGPDALTDLRRRLAARGMRLLLDFVPNHTALDHRWVTEYPSFYIQGGEDDLAREPQNYRLVLTERGPRILAHGRDPYFPGWPDTLQLNYRNPVLREAVIEELTRISGLCDGLRCDMAMLLLPSVIIGTWGSRSLPRDGTPPADRAFWPEAIGRVRQLRPDFLFMAEVYWDLEWELQQQGFDCTYDKKHYDRLRAEDPRSVRGHLRAALDYQRKSVRFLENHDEPRAAAVFPPKVYAAAALLTYLVPGLRMFHDGQFEGRRVKANVHLRRRQAEKRDAGISDLYDRLFKLLKRPELRGGRWEPLECRSAWENNVSFERFVVFSWEGEGESEGGPRLLVAVNYGPTRGQCYARVPWADVRGAAFRLRDLVGTADYVRAGEDLARGGLYLDVPEWGYHVFEVTRETA